MCGPVADSLPAPTSFHTQRQAPGQEIFPALAETTLVNSFYCFNLGFNAVLTLVASVLGLL